MIILIIVILDPVYSMYRTYESSNSKGPSVFSITVSRYFTSYENWSQPMVIGFVVWKCFVEIQHYSGLIALPFILSLVTNGIAGKFQNMLNMNPPRPFPEVLYK